MVAGRGCHGNAAVGVACVADLGQRFQSMIWCAERYEIVFVGQAVVSGPFCNVTTMIGLVEAGLGVAMVPSIAMPACCAR